MGIGRDDWKSTEVCGVGHVDCFKFRNARAQKGAGGGAHRRQGPLALGAQEGGDSRPEGEGQGEGLQDDGAVCLFVFVFVEGRM